MDTYKSAISFTYYDICNGNKIAIWSVDIMV